MAQRVWFTKGLSCTVDAIAMMRTDPAAHGLSFMASHVDVDHPLRQAADDFVQELPEVTGSDYSKWVLEVAIHHKIALIVVQQKTDDIWAAREDFAKEGVRLQIAAMPDVRALLDDKIAFQGDIQSPEVVEAGVVGHRFSEFRKLIEFDTAWNKMTALEDVEHGLCVKPARGIFGSGFRRIEPVLDDMKQILSTDPEAVFRVSLAAYRSALGAAKAPVPQMLMPFLPGLERSVDFVANNGQLLYAVSRAKLRGMQRLETKGPSIEVARVLAARYRLDGMCNLQTRENGAGQQAVLEINPRMSGGMAMACLAGVNLPLAAVLIGLERDLSDIKEPLGGALVTTQPIAKIMQTVL